VLLFFELICHDVFSHDAYLCQLISRGDLNNPMMARGGKASVNVSRLFKMICNIKVVSTFWGSFMDRH
jgi:hypothetical protein